MRYVVKELGALLTAVAANAAEALRTTAPQACDGASRFRWTAVLDRAAASALTIKVYTSVDGGTTWGLVQSQSIASGTATLSDYTQSKSASADVSVDGWVDCLGATHVKAVVAAPAGGASDLISFYGALAEMK